jgi:iron complex outermembrane receptor protein
VALLFSTVAGAAMAQEAPNASQAALPAAVAQGQRAEDQVGAIIVTARRREESAQAVPIALTVTTAQTLEQTGIANVVQLTQLVPTLQVLSPNARNTAITIRGLGASYGLANDGLE